MNKKHIFVLLVFMLLVGQASANMEITISNLPPTLGHANGGGEFAATLTPASDPIGDYVPGDTFNTFCLETNEYLVPNSGNVYMVTLSYDAIKGGSGGPQPDPLSDESAWLYTQWLDGGIVHTTTNANDLQAAVWFLEDETIGTNNSMVTDAKNAVLAGWTNKDIVVMNLWIVNPDGTLSVAQDLMVRVPIPATILLGLMGLGIGGWKLRKTL